MEDMVQQPKSRYDNLVAQDVRFAEYKGGIFNVQIIKTPDSDSRWY